MFKGKLIVFSAPSGAGKTTIVKHLLKQKELNLAFSVSATSRPKRGTEVYSDGQNAMQIENPITHEIFIRYRDDITLNNSSKIIFGERQFNIRSILNIEEKNRFFKIEAQENVAI